MNNQRPLNAQRRLNTQRPVNAQRRLNAQCCLNTQCCLYGCIKAQTKSLLNSFYLYIPAISHFSALFTCPVHSDSILTLGHFAHFVNFKLGWATPVLEGLIV